LPALDLGCGPGHRTDHLRTPGVAAGLIDDLAAAAAVT
jgi:hypothetical protein